MSELEYAAIERVEAKMEKIAEALGKLAERMAALETAVHLQPFAELKAENLRLWKQVDALNARVNKDTGERVGGSTAMQWFYRLSPWAFLVAYVVFDKLRVS